MLFGPLGAVREKAPFRVFRYKTNTITKSLDDPPKASINLMKCWQRKGDHFNYSIWSISRKLCPECLKNKSKQEYSSNRSQPRNTILI